MKIGQKVRVMRPNNPLNKGVEGIVSAVNRDDMQLIITFSPGGRHIVGKRFDVNTHRCDAIKHGFGQWVKQMEGKSNVKI